MVKHSGVTILCDDSRCTRKFADIDAAMAHFVGHGTVGTSFYPVELVYERVPVAGYVAEVAAGGSSIAAGAAVAGAGAPGSSSGSGAGAVMVLASPHRDAEEVLDVAGAGSPGSGSGSGVWAVGDLVPPNRGVEGAAGRPSRTTVTHPPAHCIVWPAWLGAHRVQEQMVRDCQQSGMPLLDVGDHELCLQQISMGVCVGGGGRGGCGFDLQVMCGCRAGR